MKAFNLYFKTKRMAKQVVGYDIEDACMIAGISIEEVDHYTTKDTVTHSQAEKYWNAHADL